jgi:hypothetical protein
MNWFDVVTNALWAAFPVVLAVLAVLPVSPREMRRFCERYGVECTAETSSTLARSIRRSRAGRLWGAAIGLSLYPALAGLGVSVPSQSLLYGLIGYLVGAFVAALIPGLPRTEPHRASLVPRRASDYLPRLALAAPTIAVATSALAMIVYALEPHQANESSTGGPAGLLLSAIAAAATLFAIRAVVGRAQPMTTADLVAADDALRTQAIHTLAGAGIAVALFGTAACLFVMGWAASFRWLEVIGVLGGAFALIGSLVAWGLRGAAWRMPRTTTL